MAARYNTLAAMEYLHNLYTGSATFIDEDGWIILHLAMLDDENDDAVMEEKWRKRSAKYVDNIPILFICVKTVAIHLSTELFVFRI